jgi:enoyl-CoA hydratase/carnithine racemase
MSSAGAAMNAIETTLDGAVARVTINRPARRNALGLEGLQELGDEIARISDERVANAVMITGTAGAFCAGLDLDPSVAPGSDPTVDGAIMAAVTRLIGGIANAPVPVLAAVDGAAAGVGMSIALSCDLVVASPRAFFLLPFTAIGLLPDGGATTTVAAAVGRARAMRMALLGERLTAAEALSAGLIAEVSEDAEETAGQWAARLADGARDALAATKAAINAAAVPNLGAALSLETREQLRLLRGFDYREGVAAFFERRTPIFGGP